MGERSLITVICTANICRSPLAEVLLQHALGAEKEPLSSLKVTSAGVSAFQGDQASLNSVKVAQTVGLDLSRHSSQPLTQALIDSSFAVFCMTESHRMLLEMQFKKTTPHIYLFRELMGGAASEQEIPDPYGQNLPAYEACRDNMVEAIPSILSFLRKQYPNL